MTQVRLLIKAAADIYERFHKEGGANSKEQPIPRLIEKPKFA